VPREENGTDEIDNAIPLCPNCHDEVHAHRVRGHGVSYRIPKVVSPAAGASESGVNCSKCGNLVRDDGFVGEGVAYCNDCHTEIHRPYSTGQVTRRYTPDELRLHRERAIAIASKEKECRPGTEAWVRDKELVLFYAQCLDRPAFRTHFHEEMSFSAFDQAMEDTLLALNTGYWRTRDGVVINRAEGKVSVVQPTWREKLDRIAEIIEEVRARFHDAMGFNEMLYGLRHRGYRGMSSEMEMMMDSHFRHDRTLAAWMDEKRNQAIETLNSILAEVGHSALRKLDK